MALIHRISLRPQVREHMMTAATGALVTKRADIDRCATIFAAWSGDACASNLPSTDDLAPPATNRADTSKLAPWFAATHKLCSRSPAAIHHRPPIHRLSSTPRVHVG
jgi:hypothetical protein